MGCANPEESRQAESEEEETGNEKHLARISDLAMVLLPIRVVATP